MPRRFSGGPRLAARRFFQTRGNVVSDLSNTARRHGPEPAPPAPNGPARGITKALWEYVSRPDIALLYDSYFRGMGLFAFDCQVLDLLLRKPGRLLDMGSGTGRHLVHFARRGFDVTGVELSQHMIGVAGRKLAAEHLSARMVQGDFCEMSAMPDGSFESVICMFSTLGMVKGRANRTAALAEAFRVLAPGGIFVMHAHNRFHNLFISGGRIRLLASYLRAFAGRGEVGDLIIDGYRGVPRMFLHSYSARELRRVLDRAGFSRIKLLHLNEERTNVIRAGPLAGLLANGFIAAAFRPVS